MVKMAESINPDFKGLTEEQKVLKILKLKLDTIKRNIKSSEERVMENNEELEMDLRTFLLDSGRNYG